MGKLGETFFNWAIMAEYAPKIWEGLLIAVVAAYFGARV